MKMNQGQAQGQGVDIEALYRSMTGRPHAYMTRHPVYKPYLIYNDEGNVVAGAAMEPNTDVWPSQLPLVWFPVNHHAHAHAHAHADSKHDDDPASPGRCWTCGRGDASLSKCTCCKIAQYCSRACQVTDWKAAHKHGEGSALMRCASSSPTPTSTWLGGMLWRAIQLASRDASARTWLLGCSTHIQPRSLDVQQAVVNAMSALDADTNAMHAWLDALKSEGIMSAQQGVLPDVYVVVRSLVHIVSILQNYVHIYDGLHLLYPHSLCVRRLCGAQANAEYAFTPETHSPPSMTIMTRARVAPNEAIVVEWVTRPMPAWQRHMMLRHVLKEPHALSCACMSISHCREEPWHAGQCPHCEASTLSITLLQVPRPCERCHKLPPDAVCDALQSKSASRVLALMCAAPVASGSGSGPGPGPGSGSGSSSGNPKSSLKPLEALCASNKEPDARASLMCILTVLSTTHAAFPIVCGAMALSMRGTRNGEVLAMYAAITDPNVDRAQALLHACGPFKVVDTSFLNAHVRVQASPGAGTHLTLKHPGYVLTVEDKEQHAASTYERTCTLVRGDGCTLDACENDRELVVRVPTVTPFPFAE